MTKNTLTPDLKKIFKKDKQALEKTDLPIITVSASYKEDLKGFYDLEENDNLPDVVFSRAHYSMALAAAVHAWKTKIDPKKAWVVDPTNFVSNENWGSIQLTEVIGKTIARYPLLKLAKDFIDKFGRNKLPILASITPPLAYLTKDIKKPILSFHIATGNILAKQGKKVIEVVTDPHVREDYLNNAELPNMAFCVFDETTKIEFLQKAKELKKDVDPGKIVVTGPPIDPRIIKARKNKKPWEGQRPLRLILSTGGLGTNKPEIKQVLDQMLPLLKSNKLKYQLMVFAATHKDIKDMVVELAQKHHVPLKLMQPTDPADFEKFAKINNPTSQIPNPKSQLTLLYHPQVIDANELLIKYGFPWADGFISKPSGDMAYDAAAAGCFLLTLKEWGEWEINIRKIFEEKHIAMQANTDNIVEQLKELEYMGWFKQAMFEAQNIEKLYLEGIENIVEVATSAS
jgi:hypothetical protein